MNVSMMRPVLLAAALAAMGVVSTSSGENVFRFTWCCCFTLNLAIFGVVLFSLVPFQVIQSSPA